MADLIDRSALKKRYITTAQSGGYSGDAMSIVINHLTRLLRLIDEAPAVEVKKGEWIDFSTSDFYDPRMRCSHCGHVELPKAHWNYCPNCGAKMEGDKTND